MFGRSFGNAVPNLYEGGSDVVPPQMHQDRTSSVNWLNKAVLSTALNSSMVLKFLNRPLTGIEWEGILTCRSLHETQYAHNPGDLLGTVDERVAANGDVTSERDFLSSFAVHYGSAGGIRGSHGYRVIRQAQDIDLDVRERVPEGGLDERRERRELYDGHAGS